MEVLERDQDGQPTTIRMLKPSDMHQHTRQGALSRLVVPMVARRFYYAIIMPNTVPPITTKAMAAGYKKEVLAAAGVYGQGFRPLLTLYLTDTLKPKEVVDAMLAGIVFGVKYYPRGLTTNSDSGVKDPSSLWSKGTQPYEVLYLLADTGGVLLLHAADGFDRRGKELDPYDQERHFIRETLPRIREAHPELKISLEHLSTAEGAEYMRKHGGKNLGCSITAHHLLLDRRDVFRGGFRPHAHWWPIIQPMEHKKELRRFVAEGRAYVWLGSDSAPHPVGKKEAACCAGGVLTAHAGIELYAEAFQKMDALDDRFENFASRNGPRFFNCSLPIERITLMREPWKVERPFMAVQTWSPSPDRPDDEEIVPFRLGETIHWQLAN